MGKVVKMVRKTAFLIAFSWLLLVTFIVVSANADNTKVQPPTSKNMVYYPQGCRCCWFIWKPRISCGQVCCGDGCCSST